MSMFSSDVNVDNTVLVDGSAVTQPVSGTVAVSNPGLTDTELRASAVPVSGPLTDTELRATPVPVNVSNVVSVITAVASSATLTQVSQPNSTSTLLLAANANRKSAILFLPKSNTSVAYDSSASATHFTYHTGASNTTIIITGYTGPIYSFGPADLINVTELV